jgi:O-methyltransferase involved in polyketide biosynthesis
VVGDLSVTALYTSQCWAWGRLSCAELFAHAEGKRVFDATNAVLAVSRVFRRDFSPLRQSLIHRHTMIDALLGRTEARQVLELAAGLSRRGAAFSADPAWRYIEMDFPAVFHRKRALLERTPAGRAVLARSNLRLVEGDVLESALEELVEPRKPLFVIAEGLMMYLKPEAQRALWQKVFRLADKTGRVTLVFDLIPACEQPRPGRVGRALGAVMKAFTGGRDFERDARTRDDLSRELSEAGFATVTRYEPSAVAAEWSLPFPQARSQQLLFCAVSP